jgi:hypothetical protein
MANYSSFYTEGYRDAENGEPCSPPDTYTRGDGVSTYIYAQEYCAGYNDAMRAWDDSNPIPIYTAGADF